MPTTAKVYAMLGNENLWQTALECHEILSKSGVAYSICGGVAVSLHGYRRNTVDLDIIIRSEDAAIVKDALCAAGLEWKGDSHEFRTEAGIAVQFLIAGDRAGNGQPVKLPDPDDEGSTETIEGVPVLRLSKLIECKLACGTGNLRRTHKDFADVVELIAIHELDGSFARYLHRSVRRTFRELVRRAESES